jgi:BolA protein
MSVLDTIETKLDRDLVLQHLEVTNESASHNVPAGSESHFKVILVAEAFEAVRLLQRHRQINKILAEELAGPVHALAIHAYTLAEWQARHGDAPLSPPCLGGSR